MVAFNRTMKELKYSFVYFSSLAVFLLIAP